MIRKPTSRRPGTSLMEVLVGFGILGIGVASVISLFPFAALTVGKALLDDRTTTCAITADGQLRDIHKRNVVEVGEGSNEPYYQRLDVGDGTRPALQPSEMGPSYPVFIDPMGVAAGRPAVVGALAPPAQNTHVPRVNLSTVVNSSTIPGEQARHALRFCSQLDGLTFNEDGAVPGGFDMRELRYNWLWVVQRPVNRDRYALRMQVVVFNQRVHQYPASMTETVYRTAYTVGSTTITGVPTSAEIRRGSWVMDATLETSADGDGVTRAKRHAEFYRVVSVDENTGTLEVHKPIRRADGLTVGTNNAPLSWTGNLVVMPSVVDVYERPLIGPGFGP